MPIQITQIVIQEKWGIVKYEAQFWRFERSLRYFRTRI